MPMIQRNHPDVSLSRECRLLSISRSSVYHRPQCESTSGRNVETKTRLLG